MISIYRRIQPKDTYNVSSIVMSSYTICRRWALGAVDVSSLPRPVMRQRYSNRGLTCVPCETRHKSCARVVGDRRIDEGIREVGHLLRYTTCYSPSPPMECEADANHHKGDGASNAAGNGTDRGTMMWGYVRRSRRLTRGALSR